MELPLQITFHRPERSDAIATNVRARRSSRSISTGFNRAASRSKRRTATTPEATSSASRVEVPVPGQQLVVTRGPDEHRSYTDVYVAIRDAFDAMRGQLEDYSAVLHGNVKLHQQSSAGPV